MGTRREADSFDESSAKSERSFSENPFDQFRSECKDYLITGLIGTGLSSPEKQLITLSEPPIPDYGELSSSICFESSKTALKRPSELASLIENGAKDFKKRLIASVHTAGEGYINFKADYPRLGNMTLDSIQLLREDYGKIRIDAPLRIIVEHTSANPAHPLHIGTARNPILGESLTRILRARGHDVSTHFYIDDAGRQIATVAYGYRMLDKHPSSREVKPDHYIGRIYAITSCLTELQQVKNRLEETSRTGASSEEKNRLDAAFKEWEQVAGDLRQKYPDLFETLEEKILCDPDPGQRIEELMLKYEAAEEETKRVFREVTGMCIEGFRDTLERLGIRFDAWDWESELVWGSSVSKVLKQLEQTVFTQRVDGALEFDAQRAVEELNLVEVLGIHKGETVPPLTLTRSDGTSLYTTRDIAYSIKKFENAEKVINVIGSEQTISQLQLRAALCVLGHRRMAENQIHFPVGLVDLPGYRMSGRRGRYITLDEVLEESQRRAFDEISLRNPSLPASEETRLAREIGIGAVIFALISVESGKKVTFVWERVLDFEQNSAPFIQYAHVRARNILEKSQETRWEHDAKLLTDPLEKSLILKLSRFPDVFLEAAETLRPRLISEYANSLAKEFNSFYASIPVIRSSPEELRSTRLCLVDSTRIVLANSLSLLGISLPSIM